MARQRTRPEDLAVQKRVEERMHGVPLVRADIVADPDHLLGINRSARIRLRLGRRDDPPILDGERGE
jgi:hypothetical protein